MAKSANNVPATLAQFALPEGWDDAMVEAHINECEYQEGMKVLNEKGLAQVTLPKETRETAENYIVPAGPLGKERWFIKKNLAAHGKGEDGLFSIIASKRQLKDRGITLN